MEKYKLGAIISYILSGVFVCIGFYKMFVYDNPGEEYLSILGSKNAYVGGDAYNYIINAEYATGFFVLAVLFAVIGATFLLLPLIDKISEKNNDNNNNITSNIVDNVDA